jgi:hypothetical protein
MRHFHHFGEVVYVKVPPGRNCGFVQYSQREDAELAMTKMQGYPILGSARLRLSWARNPSDKVMEHVRKLVSPVKGSGVLLTPGSPRLWPYLSKRCTRWSKGRTEASSSSSRTPSVLMAMHHPLHPSRTWLPSPPLALQTATPK